MSNRIKGLTNIVLQFLVHLYNSICHLQVLSHGTIAYIFKFSEPSETTQIRRSKNFWANEKLTRMRSSTKNFSKLQKFLREWSIKTLTMILLKVMLIKKFALL